jgi:hypothetical protein
MCKSPPRFIHTDGQDNQDTKTEYEIKKTRSTFADDFKGSTDHAPSDQLAL